MAEYIRLQSALLSALSEGLDLSSREYFNDVSPGEVIADGKAWRYTGHGRGITFEQLEDGTVVNVHVVPFLRDAVDAWRLELYLESRGQAATTYRSTAYDLASGQTETLLAELARDGYLKEQTMGDAIPPIVVYRPTTTLG